MTDHPPQWLSAGEVLVLRFAAHRQLARWAHKRELSPGERAKRATLVSAVRTLEDKRFADGCELHALSKE